MAPSRSRWGTGAYGALLPLRQRDENIHFGPYLPGQRLSNTAITLMNCGQAAVDITGWELSGGAGLTYTFKPGTVIPGDGGMLHVTPDVRAFRTYQRWLGGGGSIGLFVQGGFDTKLIGKWQMARIPPRK
ncbi:MAG: lamin tail domain-containing protein [Anaerolineales bacterium]|nr:lamin tail domain-containing protein [Anaerolineales bacterium]